MIKFSDISIFPVIFSLFISTNFGLRSIGINNTVVHYAILAIFLHLFFTVLMKHQVSSSVEELEEGQFLEQSAFVGIITTIVTIFSYVVLALMPFLKMPFFLLKLLPFSELWLDHFIVSLSALVTHSLGKYVIVSQM